MRRQSKQWVNFWFFRLCCTNVARFPVWSQSVNRGARRCCTKAAATASPSHLDLGGLRQRRAGPDRPPSCYRPSAARRGQWRRPADPGDRATAIVGDGAECLRQHGLTKPVATLQPHQRPSPVPARHQSARLMAPGLRQRLLPGGCGQRMCHFSGVVTFRFRD